MFAKYSFALALDCYASGSLPSVLTVSIILTIFINAIFTLIIIIITIIVYHHDISIVIVMR